MHGPQQGVLFRVRGKAIWRITARRLSGVFAAKLSITFCAVASNSFEAVTRPKNFPCPDGTCHLHQLLGKEPDRRQPDLGEAHAEARHVLSNHEIAVQRRLFAAGNCVGLHQGDNWQGIGFDRIEDALNRRLARLGRHSKRFDESMPKQNTGPSARSTITRSRHRLCLKGFQYFGRHLVIEGFVFLAADYGDRLHRTCLLNAGETHRLLFSIGIKASSNPMLWPRRSNVNASV